MEYALSNDSISIKVSTAGGSFTSIEAGGREYLWQGDPAVWSGQAPVCFPICGGLRDGSAMTFAGHHVKLARHGFARKQEWKLLSQGENELAMCLASEDNAALLSDYPYPFRLVARYTLEDAAVRVSYEVTNEDTPALGARSMRARPIRTTSCALRKKRLQSFAPLSLRLA